MLTASSERFPRMASRGLWSTTTVRSLQPSTKYRVLSNASATARASPSIGRYRDSAELVKRLPTSKICQPVWQQNGLLAGVVWQYHSVSAVARSLCRPWTSRSPGCGFCFVEDFHALAYLIQNHSLRRLEQFFAEWHPIETVCRA